MIEWGGGGAGGGGGQCGYSMFLHCCWLADVFLVDEECCFYSGQGGASREAGTSVTSLCVVQAPVRVGLPERRVQV